VETIPWDYCTIFKKIKIGAMAIPSGSNAPQVNVKLNRAKTRKAQNKKRAGWLSDFE
jgi:hypothetical protein